MPIETEPTAPGDSIDRMRALTRFLTEEANGVSRTVPGSDMNLTERRVLHELGLGTCTARDLGRHFGLDDGYLSRILKRFAARGWLQRSPSPEDARLSLLRLTPEGAAVRAGHEAAARRAVHETLARVPQAERPALDRAGLRLRAALGDPTLAAEPVVLRDMVPGDLGWITRRHAELYALEHGFDDTFGLLVAEILLAFARTRDPARERAFVPDRAGLGLGSVFCVQGPAPDQAQLRLFWLEPSSRGTGLGRRMLDAWLDFARGAGYRRATLWTHESHAAAGRLYARAGFTITGTRPTRNFGQDVVEQHWERVL